MMKSLQSHRHLYSPPHRKLQDRLSWTWLLPPLFNPPFPKVDLHWHQLVHWPQGKSFLEEPAIGSKAVLKDTWKSWFGLIAFHLRFSQRRNPNQREITLHIQQGMMSLPSCPGVKTHSVPWYSKWSFSTPSAFWLNIALYGPTPMLTVLPSVFKGSHMKSPVHNVIPVPSIFETFDLNIIILVRRYRFDPWPMVIRKLKPRAQFFFFKRFYTQSTSQRIWLESLQLLFRAWENFKRQFSSFWVNSMCMECQS